MVSFDSILYQASETVILITVILSKLTTSIIQYHIHNLIAIKLLTI